MSVLVKTWWQSLSWLVFDSQATDVQEGKFIQESWCCEWSWLECISDGLEVGVEGGGGGGASCLTVIHERSLP